MYIFIHTFRYTLKVQAGKGQDLAAVLVGAHGVLLLAQLVGLPQRHHVRFRQRPALRHSRQQILDLCT